LVKSVDIYLLHACHEFFLREKKTSTAEANSRLSRPQLDVTARAGLEVVALSSATVAAICNMLSMTQQGSVEADLNERTKPIKSTENTAVCTVFLVVICPMFALPNIALDRDNGKTSMSWLTAPWHYRQHSTAQLGRTIVS